MYNENILNELRELKENFDFNMVRIDSLCSLYSELRDNHIKEKERTKRTDVLRAAVVFMHSSFENYYRGVLICLLPQSKNISSLKNISFLGNNGRHEEKITLDGLSKYSDKSVEYIISESVKEALNSTSFNNYTDISSWSKKVNIDLNSFNQQKELDELIKRRHKIVHEADNQSQNGEHKLTQIRHDQVLKWKKTVNNLVNIIDDQLSNMEENK